MSVVMDRSPEVRKASLRAQSNQSAPVYRGPERLHVADQEWTLGNCLAKINWLHAPILVLPPLATIYALYTVPLLLKTLVWSIIYYFITGLGITAGYHRLWAHRSYAATLPVRIFLALAGAGAMEGSIKWWSRDHRAHHRYTDSEKDPYAVKNGLLYAHLGWMILKQNPKRIGRSDITDLNADRLVMWQHKHYLKIATFMAAVFPTLVAGFGWGDWMGGYFYAGVARLVFVHHATFCVNSLAHWLGDQPFDDRHSPRNHFITALLTLGEGYHNFHHEFPTDYRNAIRFYQYDPTKWLILFLSYLGLTKRLQTFSENEVQKGMLQMEQKKINERSMKLKWGTPLDKLPVIEYEEFEERSSTEPLILVSGIVHDVTPILESHPGGRAMIRSGIGKDMTAAFNGGVYDHSNAAHNLLSTMRVAVVRGGMDVETWRKMPSQDHLTGIIGKSARVDQISICDAGLQPTKRIVNVI
ncbi:stearic acid desaturase [Planoprotostelium fungivorum]|uniref:stearoyl-CoA 9-desaturase n=1 Tax=Planoprotostelium fungivorum TaxID=1890364 RepID=A0A2P6NHV4_9EUKA|nr:stearic acid desaturase [Planoprotostelium fungivorum]